MRNCIFSTMLICLIALTGTACGQSYDFVLGGCATPWQRAASVKDIPILTQLYTKQPMLYRVRNFTATLYNQQLN